MKIQLFSKIIIILLISSSNTFGQRSDLKKANRYYKEEKYAKAIPHYREVLSKKENISIQNKLAYCYKITNQLDAARALYQEIVNHKRAKAKSWYHYAETLMSAGDYEQAKVWFQKYATEKPEDQQARQMIYACDIAVTTQPVYPYVAIQAFPQNSEEDDNTAVFWAGGIVFSSDRKGKIKFLDNKSGTTNRSYLRLYHSHQLDDTTFSKPREYLSKINDARKNTGMASFTEDGRAMYFTRNGIELSRQNAFNMQLYQATSEDGKNWKNISLLPFCTKEYNYMHPAVSPDGQYLFFVSDKPGGEGGTDIYRCNHTPSGWSKPENLGPAINTAGHEGFPFFHQSGKLFFCSKGHTGLGGYDIFMSELLPDNSWTDPVNLGPPINSPMDDVSIYFDKKMEKGLLTSSRSGGDDDIFLLNLTQEPSKYASTLIKKTEIGQQQPKPEPTASEYLSSAKDIPQVVTLPPLPVPIPPQYEPVATTTVAAQETTSPPAAAIKETPVTAKPDFLKTYDWESSKITETRLFSLPTIRFDENSTEISAVMQKDLEFLAKILQHHSGLFIEVSVHVANKGDFQQRIRISQQRANQIARFLEKQGIKPHRVAPIGYGGLLPLNDCISEEDCTLEKHAVNNRIEIKTLKP